MSKLPTLTKAKIQKAALKLYRLNRLLAQHGRDGEYGDVNIHGLRCAVSAAFTVTTMKRLVKTIKTEEPLRTFVSFPSDLSPWMMRVQEAHDDWAKGITDEKPLLALLNEG